MSLLSWVVGDPTVGFLRDARKIVAQVNALESGMQELTDTEIVAKTAEFRERLGRGETLDSLTAEAFALVREASHRTTGMRHFDVQIIGGLALHRGAIAEMRTGEGKTLVATLAAYLNALPAKGVHVVTVNDYLAKRDAQWMGQIYSALGLTTGIINENFQSFTYDPNHQDLDAQRDEQGDYKIFEPFLRPVSKRQAYECDITYGTNSQFGFDYLRDNTVYHPSQLSQRGHAYAIVDEVDSILIDEARVPLILSTVSDEASNTYTTFARLATTLIESDDYTVDEKYKAIQLTNSGIDKAEAYMGVKNIYSPEHIGFAHHLENAVRAKALYLRDREYLVRDNEVLIIDTFTGRIQDGRRWSDGLHQAIEAKEGVEIKQETRTLASITYQNYFKFYTKLSGMTGTAKTSAEEFFKVYKLDVFQIPTNKKSARIDNTDLIFASETAKFRAIARKTKELNEKGQPVLIGTVSVEKNELLSQFLTQQGITHQLLNAKNHQSEGETIAAAGRRGAVTVATNMAGRGVDIKLGGPDATAEQAEEIKSLGGLFVVGTERHEARRIDNQLRGRSGRQGDPGETQFYVSMDDDLMRVFGSDRVKKIFSLMKLPEDEPIKNSMISSSLEKAQEKIEGWNFDSRKHVLQYDDIMAKHRMAIYARRWKLLHRESEYIDSLWVTLWTQSNIEEREKMDAVRTAVGPELFVESFARVGLSVLDRLWMEHLEVMDQSRRSVGLRAYGQREPLIEYTREALRLYRELEGVFFGNLRQFLLNVDPEAIRNDLTETPRERTVVIQGDDAITVEIESEDPGSILISKGGETRRVRNKKLPQWVEAGWQIVQAGRR